VGSNGTRNGAAGAQGIIVITYTPVVPPTLSTDAADTVTATSANANGNITATGGANATVRGFATSTSATLSSSVSTTTFSGSFGTGTFSATFSNNSLTGNTTYYFRAYATNSAGTGYGTIQNFLTLPAAPTSPTYSSVTQTSMTVGWLAPIGGASTYNLERCITSTNTCTLVTAIAGTSQAVSSLTGNTSYDFAVQAVNATGVGGWSATSTQLTSPILPTVTTQSASSIGATSATLNGNITATGGANATVRGFAWGTDALLSGGDTATTTENGSFGTGAFTNTSLTLACNTTYYARAYATNSAGTSYGAVSASFTTSACAQTVVTNAASGITSTGATLNGAITNTGGADATQSGFAYSTSANLTTGVSTSTLGAQSGTASFNSSLATLTANTTYYFRAYATNSAGTSYGSIQSFTTASPSRFTLLKPSNNLGLVGYWSFDEGTGTKATDFSGNGNTGTLAGSTLPSWINGKRGKALSFDGSTGKVSFSAISMGTTNSATLWVDYQDTGDGVLLGDTSGNYFFYVDQTNVYYSAGLGNFVTVAHGGLPAGQWTQLGVSRSGSTVTFYKNGVQLGSPQTLTSNSSLSISTIGSYSDSSFPAQAKIDDVRVYNRVLSASEFGKLYQNGVVKLGASGAALQAGSSLASGLVGYWTFDGPDLAWSSQTAGTVADHSGAGNTGTLTNMNRSSAPALGKLGQGLLFDGIDDYVLTGPLASSPTTETLALWVYPQAAGVIVAELGQATINTGYHFIKLGINTALTFRGNIWNCAGSLVSGTISLNTWYHLALAFTGSEERLYVNGALVSTVSCTRTPPTTQYLAFGATDSQTSGGFDSTAYFTGKMDDVRLYNRALSASEITQLYNLGRATIKR